MKYLVTSAEMRKYDNNTIEKIGIPGVVLMERAALAVVEQIQGYIASHQLKNVKILVLAGMGNNGGDGLAIARMLCESDYVVDVWCVGEEAKASGQWKQQREILRSFPVDVSGRVSQKEYTILVDALFGVGLSREVSGVYAEAIERFNRLVGYKIAVDIPSGVDADNGKILGCAIKADLTVTFGFCKRGLVMYPGCEMAGTVVTAQIGIGKQSFLGEIPGMFYYDEALKELLPKRKSGGNKGTFGKVLLIAGSKNMAGAAILAARAAYRIGAGMVKVISAPENRVIIQETVPEALLGAWENLEESISWADVLLIGPGLGKSKEALWCMQMVLHHADKPLIIDADGLNLLAQQEDLQLRLAQQSRQVVLTPHVGELARLMRKQIGELKEDLPLWGSKMAEQLHAIVVAKDARSFVCEENRPVCMNLQGNSGMATAGSGDVLAGVIGGLMAQGMSGFEAAGVGVYLHAMAGDAAAAAMGEHAVMAGDIVANLGNGNREAGIAL